MKVLIQWARIVPGGWEQVESADWASLSDKGVPVGSPMVDSAPGWVNALNVQGAVFEGYDRLAVIDNGDGSIRVYCVNDDPAHWDAVTRYARVVDILPLAADEALGGAVNTRISQTVFSDDPVFTGMAVQSTVVRPWSELTLPSEGLFRHGVMMPDARFEAHVSAREVHTWREWVNGVDPLLVSEGKLVQQRRSGRYLVPDGTRTYYLNNVALASGVHAGDFELALQSVPGGQATVQSGNVGSNGSIVAVGTTSASEPNNAAWPTGNYRCQIDVLSVNTDITYGLLTQGTALGHFARVDSGLASDLETKAQIEAAFSFPGIRLATTGSVSWAGGAASDRFEVSIAAVRASGHGNSTITLEIGESDDFADGPWPSGVAADNAPFFGSNM